VAKAQLVSCTDPFSLDPGLASLEEMIDRSEVLFVVTPHRVYFEIVIPAGKRVIDPWGILDARRATPGTDITGNGSAVLSDAAQSP
jgi:hypothetical protein